MFAFDLTHLCTPVFVHTGVIQTRRIRKQLQNDLQLQFTVMACTIP